jgi:hypothetical protein
MERSSSPGNSFEEAAQSAGGTPDAAPVVGDADAVQKTTWVVGHGTDPADTRPEDEAEHGRTPSGAPPYASPPRGTDGLDR